MNKFLVAAAALLLLNGTAQAQDGPKSALDLPPGQALVNLSASERAEVQQDLLVANLQYQAENKNARALQDDINTLMKKAVEKAKTYKDIKVSTQQYYVYLHEPQPEPRPMGSHPQKNKPEKTWRGNQGLQLESKNADDLLELTGALQDMGLIMNGLNYTVSTELMETTHDSLMEKALAKLKAKAERAAKALGKSQSDLIEVNIDSGGYHPQPMMRGMAMDAKMEAMSAPVAEAGTSDINLTVSARALLKP